MTSSPAAGDGVHNVIRGGLFFNAVVQGQSITLHLPREITPALAGLPPSSSVFTGRDDLLRSLSEALDPRQPGPRAVLVTGLAGVGKTELALQVARRALAQPNWYPGGVLFTDLFGYDPTRKVTPEHALDGFLRALGVPGEYVPPALQDRSSLYRSVLTAYAEQGMRILVVIDNAADASQIRPLLPSDGTSATLVTSRNIPDVGARQVRIDSLGLQEAVDLLARILHQAHGSTDTRVANEAPQAERIAELCGRLPLALQIAGAQLADTPARPLASFAHALTDTQRRLDRLTREEMAVRAAFDLSYERLGDEQARLFRLLSLNPGPDVNTDAAAALVGADRDIVEEWLQDLSRANLVEAGSVWGRWRLHDLVRLYATQLAQDDGEGIENAVSDLLRYYVTVTAHAEQALAMPLVAVSTESGSPASGPFQDLEQVFLWLQAEQANLVAAVILANETGRWRLSANLAQLLVEYLSLHRHHDEAITLRRQALIAARHLGNRQEEGEAVGNLGFDLYAARRYEEAAAAQRESLAIAVEVGNRENEHTALMNLGIALAEVGQSGEAIDAHTQALAIARELGDRSGEAADLNNLANALVAAGRLEEAQAPLMESRAICQELGDERGEARASNNIGALASRLGQHELAVAAHRYCVAVNRLLGDVIHEGESLINLALSLNDVDQPEEAVEACTTALGYFTEVDARHHQQKALRVLADSCLSAGRPAEAVDACLRSLAIRHDMHLPQDEDEERTLLTLGRAYEVTDCSEAAAEAYTRRIGLLIERDAEKALQGEAFMDLGVALLDNRPAEAVEAFSQGHTIFHELGDQRAERTSLRLLGLTHHLMERFEEAAEAHQRSLELSRALGDHEGERDTLAELADSLAEAGKLSEALAAYTEALAACQALDDQDGQAELLAAMGEVLIKMGDQEQATTAFAQATAIKKQLLRQLKQGSESAG
ncbi:tetratricopeptide repeat protein [Streptomyces sp. NPDC000851]